ncbi:MAG TPA: hypothetical protein VJ724_16010 [Tahibacter sp.]|nr:hypothetical protein [Tahibacter sp.]
MAFSSSSLVLASLLLIAPASVSAISATEPALRSTSVYNGRPVFGPCLLPRLSDDGRFLSMACLSSDAVFGDDNDRYDTVLKDLSLGTTERISLDESNHEVRQHSGVGIPSPDGRYVVFNAQGVFHRDVGWIPVGPADASTNNVFLRDTAAGTTELVSRDYRGNGNPESLGAYLRDATPSRNEALFSSEANYLGSPGPRPVFVHELFVRNWATGAIERISARPDGGQSSSSALLSVLDRNGRYVAFVSDATDITADNPLGHSQLFLRDRQSHTTTRLTRRYDGAEFSTSPFFYDPKGTTGLEQILFGAAFAAGFTPDDSSSWLRLYLLNRTTGTVELLSRGSAGEPVDNSTFAYDISADGRVVAFFTRATNILPTPNPATAIYVKDRTTGQIINVTAPLGTSGTFVADLDLSADGRRLAFSWRTRDPAQPAIDDRILVYTVDLAFGEPSDAPVAVPLSRHVAIALLGLLAAIGMAAVRHRRC